MGGVDALIVENHELLASTLALALRQHGLRAETVAGPSPEAVVEEARQVRPAVVLLDLNLGPPLGSGLDLIGPLVDTGTRVVMMTGVIDPVRLATCVEAGACGIVNKTSGFDELIEAIGRAVRGEALMTDAQRQSLLSELRASRAADRERLARFRGLSRREQEVLARLMAGQSAQTIADQSFVSLATVRTQIRSILLKLGTNSQLAAVAMARDAGWSPPAR
jgi:DNA-binding NarL/FixJ family response regulator